MQPGIIHEFTEFCRRCRHAPAQPLPPRSQRAGPPPCRPRRLTVTGTSTAAAAIAVGTGFVQSDGGFLATAATATSYNSIQAPAGGVYARSLGASTYTQVGNSPGTPTTTSGDAFRAGALYYNTALGALQVYNGSSWSSVSGGSSGGVTTLMGTANQVLVNGTYNTNTSGGIILTLPQSIGTTSIPTFAAVIANGAFNSLVTGANVGLQTGGGMFQAFGNGNVNGNIFNALTGFQINGNSVINSSRQFVGSGIDVSNGGVQAGGYNVYGGYLGQTANVQFSSPFTWNGSGSFTTLVFRGGVLVSAY